MTEDIFTWLCYVSILEGVCFGIWVACRLKNDVEECETSARHNTLSQDIQNKHVERNLIAAHQANEQTRKILTELADKVGYRIFYPTISTLYQNEKCDCHEPKLVKLDEVQSD